jgi:hypothetical protein
MLPGTDDVSDPVSLDALAVKVSAHIASVQVVAGSAVKRADLSTEPVVEVAEDALDDFEKGAEAMEAGLDDSEEFLDVAGKVLTWDVYATPVINGLEGKRLVEAIHAGDLVLVDSSVEVFFATDELSTCVESAANDGRLLVGVDTPGLWGAAWGPKPLGSWWNVRLPVTVVSRVAVVCVTVTDSSPTKASFAFGRYP